MKRTRSRIAALALLCIGLGLGLRFWLAPHGADAKAQARASNPGAAMAMAPAPPPSQAASPAIAAAPGSAVAADATAAGLSPRARRMRDDWCGYGMRELHKEEMLREAARQQGQASGDEAREPSDADQVMNQASDQVLASWIQTLRGRQDLRSQAVADYLADDTPSRAHLQDLARRSTDPMVTALALQRPCKTQGCTTVDAAQWARLEPDNLAAWMAQVQGRRTPPEQLGYLIERMGRDASRNDDYLLAFSQTLAELASTQAPGLRQMAESNMLVGTTSAWSFPTTHPLLERCQSDRLQPATAAHCARIALLMWDSPSLLTRGLALSLARRVVPPGHAQRADWEQRALRYDGLLEVTMNAPDGLNPTGEGPSPQHTCLVAAVMHEDLRSQYRQGEWTYAESTLARMGEPLEALARKTRSSRGGRSVLEDSGPANASVSASR